MASNEGTLSRIMEHGVRPVSGSNTFEIDPIVMAWLATRLAEASREASDAATPKRPQGRTIGSIPPGSLSARLGLRASDVVETINGVRVVDLEEIQHAIAETASAIDLGIVREDYRLTLRYQVSPSLAWNEWRSSLGIADPGMPEQQEVERDATESIQPVPVPAKHGPAPVPSRRSPEPTPRPQTPSRSRTPPAASVSESCATPESCVVAKSSFDALVANPGRLDAQARIVPAIANDVFSGYKLKTITPGSDIAKLGFRPEDKVTHINGLALANDVQAAQLYMTLATTRVFRIRYERNGSAHTKTVTLEADG